jgi:hypothetical protein
MTATIFPPPINAAFLNQDDFDLFLSQVGQRVSWLRSHACPCVWSRSGSISGRLSMPGSPQPQCLTCAGAGIYWDQPSELFTAGVSFRHLAFSPDEPGMRMSDQFGVAAHSEPAMTIPYHSPLLSDGDARQPTAAWWGFSVNDIAVLPDMTARYQAVLQEGGQQNLPYQQNLCVEPYGAVTIWDPVNQLATPVSGYVVSGATVTVPGLASGTNYMVEFTAGALYVAFRRAGALPHSRPLVSGTMNLPKAFRLQTLDFWTRERNIQPRVNVCGTVLALSVGMPYG